MYAYIYIYIQGANPNPIYVYICIYIYIYMYIDIYHYTLLNSRVLNPSSFLPIEMACLLLKVLCAPK